MALDQQRPLNDLHEGDGPTVSVVVPTKGDQHRVGDALESIAAQTHRPIEIVIVDGTGVDWLAKLDEVDGVTYLKDGGDSISAARNQGIDVATGAFVAFCDADDLWEPGKVASQLTEFEGGAHVVYTDFMMADETGGDGVTIWEERALPVDEPDSHHAEFLLNGGVPMSSVMARASCFDSEAFDERLPLAEDRNLLARLFYRYRPGRVAEPLVTYRVREGDQLTDDARAMYEAELQNLSYLRDEIPEIATMQDQLERRAKYALLKGLLRAGKKREARRVLVDVLTSGHVDLRTLALVVVSCSPTDSATLLRRAERMYA